MDIKLIALDLDGTLLDSNKVLTERNRKALERAAEKGVEIVPTTGRLFVGMPDNIKALAYLHYAVTINGAAVFDVRNNRKILKAELPFATALSIYQYLDTFPIVYDSYIDDLGFITQEMKERIDQYTDDEYYRDRVRVLRKGLPSLPHFVKEEKRDVQKIQLFTMDRELKAFLMKDIAASFPCAAVTSSFKDNIEITLKSANKGDALKKLVSFLRLSMDNVVSFGDADNDVTMIKESSLGIAMANGSERALEAARIIAPSCDEDGVAVELEKLGF